MNGWSRWSFWGQVSSQLRTWLDFGEGRIFLNIADGFFQKTQPILQELRIYEDPPPWAKTGGRFSNLQQPGAVEGDFLTATTSFREVSCKLSEVFQVFFGMVLGDDWMVALYLFLVLLMVKLLFFWSQTSLDIRRWRMILGHHSCFRAKMERILHQWRER